MRVHMILEEGGSRPQGRSGPGTLADASCQDHPETTGSEDCVAGGPGLCSVPPPSPCPPGGHSPLPCPTRGRVCSEGRGAASQEGGRKGGAGGAGGAGALRPRWLGPWLAAPAPAELPPTSRAYTFFDIYLDVIK